MKEELAKVTVFRYDPTNDPAPWYQELEGIPYQKQSVLQVLNYISHHIDSSLSFRTVCVKGRCGSCALVVNDEPVLSCCKEAEQIMTIKPHSKFEIIKDLFVDFHKMNKGASHFSFPGREVVIDLTKCVHCRDCLDICPVGVFGLTSDKKITVVDSKSCLGTTCLHCADSCWKNALTIKDSLPL